jgi:hypothetical protein
MAISITTDPIVSLTDAKAILGIGSDLEAALLINAVSAKFLRYTNRVRINEGGAVEWAQGGRLKVYCHASPVDSEAGFTVSVYQDGEIAETLTLTDGDFRVVNSETDSYIELIEYSPPLIEGLDTLKLEYTGGWSSDTGVPGDIVLAAIDQMRVERERRNGTLGAMSVSQNGQTVQLETSGLIRAVEEAWRPYRYEV